jgi:hypothetical protein
VNGKGEIIQFSNMSRYSRNLSRPVTMFMLVLVPGTVQVLGVILTE